MSLLFSKRWALICVLLILPLRLQAQHCQPFLFLNCPEDGVDEQSFIDGFSVQVNGATNENCGPAPEFSSWDWGDGTPAIPSYFPGSHTYSKPGNYTLTVSVGDFSEQCQFRVPRSGQSTGATPAEPARSDFCQPFFVPDDGGNPEQLLGGDKAHGVAVNAGGVPSGKITCQGYHEKLLDSAVMRRGGCFFPNLQPPLYTDDGILIETPSGLFTLFCHFRRQ